MIIKIIAFNLLLNNQNIQNYLNPKPITLMDAIYSISQQKAVQVLSINSLLDEWQNRRILRELQGRITTNTNHFVIDLAQLSFINSSGLNFLLMLYAKTRKSGGSIILANASKRIRHVLDITKLSTVFPIKTSVASAVNYSRLKAAA